MLKQKSLKKIILFLSFAFAACAYKVDKNPVRSADLTDTKPKAPLTFQLVETNVLKAKCVECHSNETKNSGKVNLETYGNVIATLSDIKDCVSNGEMPKSPGTPLTAEEKFLLLSWIEQGAPETTPNTDGPPSPSPTPQPAPGPTPAPSPAPPGLPTPTPTPSTQTDPPVAGLEPTFTSINNLIIKAKCLDCHNSNGDASDAPFEQYSDLVSGTVVVPSSPSASSLIAHITLGAKKLMPPAKSKFKPIAPEDVAIISKWIADGAKNN